MGDGWRHRHDTDGLVRPIITRVSLFAPHSFSNFKIYKTEITIFMKKVLIIILVGLLKMTPSVSAQTGDNNAPKIATTKKLKVVFHLTSSDTLVHKAVVKQLNNFLVAAPNAKIEVVCHNNGIEFLTSAKTKHSVMITELKSKGITFAACENTMRERKIKKEEIVSEAFFVPSGVVEVALKQSEKWSYIKAGF